MARPADRQPSRLASRASGRRARQRPYREPKTKEGQGVDASGTVLLVGASRGLGLAMAGEFAKRGWRVVGTVRGAGRTDLHDLAEAHPGRVAIEALDITEPQQIAALRERLEGRVFDILFVNAGTANRRAAETIGEVPTDEFVRVMLTNVLGVMRAVEGLHDLVAPEGVIGVMSSGQGSIANNARGGFEVYRDSKAALNQSMRSFAARHADDPRAMVLMAPGWIRTGLGGPDAPFGIEETIPQVVTTLVAQQGAPGLRFIDRHGETVPW
jgi:NAD(P)-dependent dehydrogenase (short-subunit alcohol dehydrogenase family)